MERWPQSFWRWPTPAHFPKDYCTRLHRHSDQGRQMDWHMVSVLNDITGSIFWLRFVLCPLEMTSIAGLAAELFEPVDTERAAPKHVFRPVAGSEDRAVDLLLLVDVDAESSQILQPEIAVAIDLGVG